MVLDIASELQVFSDTELERNYSSLSRRASTTREVVVDARYVPWFDLWTMMQLLLLLESDPFRTTDRRVLLASPDAAGGRSGDRARQRAISRLRFLTETEFLARAEEIGVALWIQTGRDPSRIERIRASTVPQIAAGPKDSNLVSDDSSAVIPITRLRDLSLEGTRDRLYQKAEQLLGGYASEAVVESAGLGDCLLTELALNAQVHGGNDGYVALRAAASLDQVRRVDFADYRLRRFARLNHRLGDWQRYYTTYPDDGYFELVVVDRGPGIAATIQGDPRLPEEILHLRNPLARTHALVSHALDAESSRFSPQQRVARGMTEFTGLGAVSFVLQLHEGSLLIRESRSRHIFGKAAPRGGAPFSTIAPVPRRLPQSLAHLPGTSVTALVPMRRVHHSPPGIQLKRDSRPHQADEDATVATALRIFRIPSPATTVLDRTFGAHWKSITAAIGTDPGESRAVVVDVSRASLEKNAFWPGFVGLLKACARQHLPLFLIGVSPRAANRIEEFASLDRKLSAAEPSWLSVGLGDDSVLYAFGHFSGSIETRHNTAIEIAARLSGGRHASIHIEQLLTSAHFLQSTVADDHPDPMIPLASLLHRLHNVYAVALLAEIRASPAWLSGHVVQFAGGAKLMDYLCIHSLTQLRSVYSDLARLACILASRFEFDFVLSVGAASQSAALFIAETLSHSPTRGSANRLRHYAYQDYFGFDYGESPRQVVPAHARVLLVVDGVRTGAHCSDAIDHIVHSEATPVGVLALCDFSERGFSFNTGVVPFLAVLHLPVRSAPIDADPEYFEMPFSFELIAASQQTAPDEPPLLTKAQSYAYLEAFGLIFIGHSTFFDQHFARTVSLPYLLNSSAPLKAEIVHRTARLITQERIDCILFPEHSSISALADEVLAALPKRVATIMCRRTTWPDQGGGYNVDLIGKETLRQAKRLLILEDETYTGNSIKGLLAIALSPGASCSRIVVLTIIDSLRRTERNALARLTHLHGRPAQRSRSTSIAMLSFMSFSLCAYWSEASCPLCRLLRSIGRTDFQQLGFIEEAYARERLEELEPHQTDQDYRARRSLHPLRNAIEVRRTSTHPTLTIATLEGLELFCEEAYVDGDVAWLVQRCTPGHAEQFPLETLLAVIELLSRDFGVLGVELRRSFLEAVRLLLFGQGFRGRHLALLLETLSNWPVHCLAYLWDEVLHCVFREDVEGFTDCYPALELLLLEIERRRRPKTVVERLLRAFDRKLTELLEDTPLLDRARRTKVDFAMCLRRGVSRRTAPPAIGTLVADAAFLLAYFAPTRPSHWVFRGGLNALSKASPNDDARVRAFVIQMADQLRFTLEELRVREPGATDWSSHAGYGRLDALLLELHSVYPRTPRIGERADHLQRIGSELLELLYNDTSAPSFHTTLSKYLDDRRLSVVAVLAPVLSLHESLGITIEYGTEVTRLGEVFVVLDSNGTALVFGELANNLRRTYISWSESRPPRELFGGTAAFALKINVDTQEINTLALSLENPCEDSSYRRMIAGTEGFGLAQIKTTLERFGHSFRLDYDAQRQRLTQILTMRRIPR